MITRIDDLLEDHLRLVLGVDDFHVLYLLHRRNSRHTPCSPRREVDKLISCHLFWVTARHPGVPAEMYSHRASFEGPIVEANAVRLGKQCIDLEGPDHRVRQFRTPVANKSAARAAYANSKLGKMRVQGIERLEGGRDRLKAGRAIQKRHIKDFVERHALPGLHFGKLTPTMLI